MSSFKVCTYHIKFNNADEIYKKIFDLTMIINKKYCELNNYNYCSNLYDETVFNNFLDDEVFKIERKWDKACIFKYQYLLDILNTSKEDFIVYVEYDACFCNTIKKLENYIDDEHSIFYSRCNWSFDIRHYYQTMNELVKFLNENSENIFNYDRCSSILMNDSFKENLQTINHFFFCNEGFYIFKNDGISKKFLKCMIKYSPLFNESYKNICSESQCVGKLMSNPFFKNHIKVLPPKTQGHIYGGSNSYNEDECLVCHNSGIDKKVLYDYLIKISKNKYWSKLE